MIGKFLISIVLFFLCAFACAEKITNINDIEVGDVVRGVVRFGSNDFPLAQGDWRVAHVEDGRVNSDNNSIAGDSVYAIFEREMAAGQYVFINSSVDIITGDGWNTTACDKHDGIVFLEMMEDSYSYPECVNVSRITLKDGRKSYLASYMYFGFGGYAKISYLFPDENGGEERSAYLSRMTLWVKEMGRVSRISLRNRDKPILPSYF